MRELKAAQDAKEKRQQEAKDRTAREANETKANQVNRQQAEKTLLSVPSPDQPDFSTITNATKKANKKGPMCYFSDERGHTARNCFKKQAKLNGVANITSCPPSAKSAPTIEATSKPLPPTPAAKKNMAELPLHSNSKAEHGVSVDSTENASISEPPTKAANFRRRPSELHPKTKVQANDANTDSQR